jgi:hypothetical protein
METAIESREAEMENWNDGRLDDLSKRVDDLGTKTEARFDRLERKVDQGFARIDSKFDALGDKFDALHQMLFKAAWALVVGLITLVGALAGVIGTQL